MKKSEKTDTENLLLEIVYLEHELEQLHEVVKHICVN